MAEGQQLTFLLQRILYSLSSVLVTAPKALCAADSPGDWYPGPASRPAVGGRAGAAAVRLRCCTERGALLLRCVPLPEATTLGSCPRSHPSSIEDHWGLLKGLYYNSKRWRGDRPPALPLLPAAPSVFGRGVNGSQQSRAEPELPLGTLVLLCRTPG